MSINWSNNSALAGFQNALALGADIGGAIRQNRENSALAAFMTAGQGGPTGGAPTGGMGAPSAGVANPPIPTQWGGNGGGIVPTETQQTESQAAYERLAKINPRLAMQAQDRVSSQQKARAELMKEQRAADLRSKAAQGDPAALQELVGIDFDSWKALDAGQRQRVKEVNEYTGQAGLRISQLPPEQRAAAWDQAIQSGVARGYKELSVKQGQYSEKALTDVIDGAGLVDKFLSLAEPDYKIIPSDADMVNVKDPNAVKQFQSGRTAQVAAPASKADYDALPPGAQYRAPDGSIKRKGGGVSNGTGGF